MQWKRIWLKNYPPGVPADVDVTQYRSLPELLEDSLRRYAKRDAFIFMEHALTYAELDRQSAAFGAWLQGSGLPRGFASRDHAAERAAVPGRAGGALRAGYVVVNVKPALHARELEHQLKGLGRRGDRDTRELRGHPAAGDRQDRREARDRDLARRPVGFRSRPS